MTECAVRGAGWELSVQSLSRSGNTNIVDILRKISLLWECQFLCSESDVKYVESKEISGYGQRDLSVILSRRART